VLLPQAPAVFPGSHKRQPSHSVNEIALGSVEAANAADVTVENHGAVAPVDAHESSCPRANSLLRLHHTYNITNSPKAIGPLTHRRG
jgi:hypothetical protein